MKLLTVSSFAAFAVFVGLALHAQAPDPAQAKAKAKAKGARPPVVDTLGDGPWDLKTETGNVHVTVVTKGLDHPWGLAILPNGDMLVTERPGRLRVVHNVGGKGILDPTPLTGL